MKCYTYVSGRTTAGINHNGGTKKTCAIKLNIPYDWDADRFMANIQHKESADIFLYCVSEIVEGDSLSSVFPENCFLIHCPELTDISNYNCSCFEITINESGAYYVLFENSILKDTTTSSYIINENGKPKIVSSNPTVEGLTSNDTAQFSILL